MKKVLLLSLLLPTLLFAQESEQYGFKLGPSIINLQSSISGQKINYNYNWRIGYQAGFTYKYNMSNGFTSFIVDAIYAQKGTKQGYLVQNGNYNIKLHYLNIPLLFAYTPSESFNVYAGLEFGLLVKSQINFQGQNINVDQGFRTFELNPIVGFSYTMPSNVFLDARYSFGILDIDEPVSTNGTSQGVNAVKTVTQSFQFSIGYYFSRNEF